jgi:hypothetical protein
MICTFEDGQICLRKGDNVRSFSLDEYLNVSEYENIQIVGITNPFTTAQLDEMVKHLERMKNVSHFGCNRRISGTDNENLKLYASLPSILKHFKLLNVFDMFHPKEVQLDPKIIDGIIDVLSTLPLLESVLFFGLNVQKSRSLLKLTQIIALTVRDFTFTDFSLLIAYINKSNRLFNLEIQVDVFEGEIDPENPQYVLPHDLYKCFYENTSLLYISICNGRKFPRESVQILKDITKRNDELFQRQGHLALICLAIYHFHNRPMRDIGTLLAKYLFKTRLEYKLP